MCYSGQLGAFKSVLPHQQRSMLSPDWDVFIYTSQLISQKVNNSPNYQPASQVYEYLPANKGWRKNQNSYGIIYEISKEDIETTLSPLRCQIKDSLIEMESLQTSLKDHEMTKWEWLRLRQLRKMYNCNQLRKKYEEKTGTKYDIIVRSRFDIVPTHVDVVKLYKEFSDPSLKQIFLFGGWSCVPPMVFMDEFICDGFAFGSPEVMDVFSSLYLKEEPYPFDIKYKETWEKYGDNVEYQLREHLERNGVELVYVKEKRSEYHLWR